MIQPFHHFCSFLLDSFQSVHVSLLLGSQELNTDIQVWPHQCSVEGKEEITSQPADNTFFNAAQDIFHLLSGKSTLLHDMKPAVHQDPQYIFCEADSQLNGLQNLLVPGIFSYQLQDFTLLLAEAHEVPSSPFLPACKGPTGWQHDRLAYHPLIPALCHHQAHDEDVKQD